MKTVLIIGLQAFQEEIRRKTLYLFFLFPLTFVYASTFLTFLTPGAEKSMIMDVSLSSISFFMMLMIASISSDLFIKEAQQGTLYFFTTNPVRGSALIFGKMLGIFAFLFCGTLFIGIFACLLLYIKTQQLDFDFIKAILLLMGEFAIVLGYGALGATLFSKFTNLLFIIVIYMIGHLATYFDHFKEHLEESPTSVPLQWILNFIPDLNRFELRDSIILGFDLEWGNMMHSFLYAFFWITLLGILSAFLLKRRYAS